VRHELEAEPRNPKNGRLVACVTRDGYLGLPVACWPPPAILRAHVCVSKPLQQTIKVTGRRPLTWKTEDALTAASVNHFGSWSIRKKKLTMLRLFFDPFSPVVWDTSRLKQLAQKHIVVECRPDP